MHKFLVTYGNKSLVIEADDLYSAKQKGIQKLNVPLSRLWQVDVRLVKDDEVTIDSNDI